MSWILLFIGCPWKRTPPPTPASTRPCLRNAPPEEIAQWELAVIAPDTPLRTSPDMSAPAFRTEKHTPARILETVDGWLRLQIGDNLGCYFDPAGLAGLQLIVWAPSDQTAPVITQTTRIDYADGTSLTLRAGMALIPSERPGWYQIVDQIASPIIRIQQDIIGTTYREDSIWFSTAERGLSCDELDGHTVLNGETLPLLPSQSPVLWAAGGPTTDLATFSSFCARYTARVPTSAWQDDLDGGLLFGINTPRVASGFALESGVPVWWPDDTLAGQTRCPEIFGREVEASPSGRRCFLRDPVTGWRDDLSLSDPGVLTLCFDVPAADD